MSKLVEAAQAAGKGKGAVKRGSDSGSGGSGLAKAWTMPKSSKLTDMSAAKKKVR